MKIKRALIISRPLAWFWTVGAYLIGIGPFSNFTLISMIEFLFMFFPINFIVYGINDIYDRESDEKNPNKDNIQGTIVKKEEEKQIKIIAMILSAIFILIAFVSKNPEHIILSSLLIFIAYIYSTPPIRMKTKPFLDSIFGSIGYLFPVFIAFTTHNTLSNIDPSYLLLLLPLIAGHAIFALRDVDHDKKTKMKTIGVFLGKRRTLVFALTLFLIPISFLDDLFLKSVLITGALSIMITMFTDLKEGKYILPLIAALNFMIVLGLIYFILQANLG